MIKTNRHSKCNKNNVVISYIAIIFALCVTLPLQSEALVSLATKALTVFQQDTKISNILVIDNVAVHLSENKTWVYDTTNEQWTEDKWHPNGPILATTVDQQYAYVVYKNETNTVIDQLIMESAQIVSRRIATLSEPLTSIQIAKERDQLFIVTIENGTKLRFQSIDLNVTDSIWKQHEAWLGTGYVKLTSLAAQNDLLVLTGLTPDGRTELNVWSKEKGWVEAREISGSVVAGGVKAVGQGHILYLLNSDSTQQELPRIASYHTITRGWATHGEIDASHIWAAASWGDGFIWTTGDSKTVAPTIFVSELDSQMAQPAQLDWLVIASYLIVMLGIGYYFYKKDAQKSEAEFFLGGRSIPFWAAGISLYVSNASSISYIAVPAKAFATNWTYLLGNFINGLAIIIVAVWIVPILRRLDLMSIFHYLETRFHPSIRVLSSALFVIGQLAGRMTIILFIPSLAISAVTGFDISMSILVMGIVTVIYTVLGGMKAVIWTDFLQLFVMFGGTIFTLVYIVSTLDGGAAEFISISMADNKMKLADWSFDPNQATVWVLMFVVLFDTVLTFPKDQVLMQRVLSTKSAKDASRSVWAYAILVLPASLIFYLVGTALYVFYQAHPERMDPTLSIDATFPLFISAELPIGITGLLIAGIFSASMSTLSSILNSVATVSTVDFYEKIVTVKDHKKSMRFAEIITVVSGIIGIGLALILTRFEINSILDLALEIWGLVGGGFAGAYTLGMFTRRANWQGIAIGVAVSIVVTIYVWTLDVLHPFFYLPLAIMVCIIAGYASSWFFPAPQNLKGLTIFKQDAVNEAG